MGINARHEWEACTMFECFLIVGLRMGEERRGPPMSQATRAGRGRRRTHAWKQIDVLTRWDRSRSCGKNNQRRARPDSPGVPDRTHAQRKNCECQCGTCTLGGRSGIKIQWEVAPSSAGTGTDPNPGTVTLDPTRVGRDASRIADEVVAHLGGLMDSTVKVTLEIEAEIPSGAPENVVRTVTENSRMLKFTSHGFEKK